MGGPSESPPRSPSALDARPREAELGPPALLPPGQTQYPLLGSPRVGQEFSPQYLFCLLILLLLAPENVISESGNRVDKGLSRNRCVFRGDAGDGRSHSPSSSYDCQGQGNAEAHCPHGAPLGPSCRCEKRSQGFVEKSGPSWLRGKATLFLYFSCPLSHLFAEHLLCAQHIPI